MESGQGDPLAALGLLSILGPGSVYLARRAPWPVTIACMRSIAAIALWTRRQLAIELAYFWSLSASLQATLTPDLGRSFPSVYYFTYFEYHIGAVIAGCMLVFGCGRYPRPRGAWRVFAVTLAFAAVSGTADLLTGGNYMHLRPVPSTTRCSA